MCMIFIFLLILHELDVRIHTKKLKKTKNKRFLLGHWTHASLLYTSGCLWSKHHDVFFLPRNLRIAAQASCQWWDAKLFLIRINGRGHLIICMWLWYVRFTVLRNFYFTFFVSDSSTHVMYFLLWIVCFQTTAFVQRFPE